MGTLTAAAPSSTSGYRRRMALGLALLAAGCLGHLLAARAIGGSRVAYQDHMIGFVGVAVITGALIAGIGRWRWRGRLDVSVLAIGVAQALFGLFIYVERFHVH